MSKLIIKNNKVELLIVDTSKPKPEAQLYLLNYNFGGVDPSPHIVQEFSTGRYFIYDNKNKILCFSHCPKVFSEKDDKSKPLIEMFLEDENIRYDPTLYIKEF